MRHDTRHDTYRESSIMRITTIATLFASACIATAAPALAQSASEEQRFETAQRRFDSELAQYRIEFDRYQAARRNRPYSQNQNGYNSGYNNSGYNDPRYDDANYDPVRDYRSGSQYRERVLASDERVYRGSDGRNYCRRSDGTTGLIVGASTNSMLGSVLSGVGSGTVGTLLGAILNRSSSASAQVRCR